MQPLFAPKPTHTITMCQSVTSNDPAPVKVKVCSVCGHKGPEWEFRENRRQCLPCSKTRARRSTSNWYKNNKEHVAAYDAERYKNNPEYFRQQRIKYQEANRDRLNQHYKDYRLANIEKCKAYDKAYNRTPMGKARSANGRHKRREKLKGSGIPSAKIVELMKASKKCPYCLEKYTRERKRSVDHVKPFKLGGTHTLDNIIICCNPCNIRKQAQCPLKWAASLGLLLI